MNTIQNREFYNLNNILNSYQSAGYGFNTIQNY